MFTNFDCEKVDVSTFPVKTVITVYTFFLSIYNFVLAKLWLTNGIQIQINKEYIGSKAKKNYT